MNVLIATSVLGLFAMISEIIGLKRWIWYISIAGLAGIIGLGISEYNTSSEFYGMLHQNTFSSVFSVLLLSITLVWFLLSHNYYHTEGNANASDQAALIIFATTGGLILTSFTNLTMLFLGIEIMSIPMYILAGSDKKNLNSNESSLKYFILGAFATGILLFGIALLYGATASFDLLEIRQGLMNAFTNPTTLFLSTVGILLILVGLAFKVTAVPFHFWAPDVYEGAPTIITAFMSTFVKTAAFVSFFRLFVFCFIDLAPLWQFQILIISGFTILGGNILAVSQSNMKRTLAYSGIAQAGYILLTILLPNRETLSALFIYTTSYSISTLVAFTVVYHVQKTKRDYSFEAFKGLAKSNPGLAAVLSLSMLSLAGIPPTVGFFAKFYLFKSILSFNIGFIWIILLAIIGSLISLYYYFKVIISMFGGDESGVKIELKMGDRILIYVIASLIIVLGLIPEILLQLGSLII
ncbi:MAG TPA: NADH-quinone oxidoreductase subunit N [Cytophagaceae bacterium]|jgi:NADH-quinone oxidoreductase subunit N|nr:NADH-quinone oxidoreductase subunit N [Cytophagaceae bacterium]